MRHQVNGVEIRPAVPLIPTQRRHDLFLHAVGGFQPDFDSLVVALLVGDRSVFPLPAQVHHLRFGPADNLLFSLGNAQIVRGEAQTAACGFLETDFLHAIEQFDSCLPAQHFVAIGNDSGKRLLVEHDIVEEGHALVKDFVEDNPPHGGGDNAIGGCWQITPILAIEGHHLFVVWQTHTDFGVGGHLL
ncbi:hypothetical protein HRbin36_02079 [bacterium HR36]|nr:hypothetical protein HRbin36_02079 [bacterium HR36]